MRGGERDRAEDAQAGGFQYFRGFEQAGVGDGERDEENQGGVGEGVEDLGDDDAAGAVDGAPEQ